MPQSLHEPLVITLLAGVIIQYPEMTLTEQFRQHRRNKTVEVGMLRKVRRLLTSGLWT